MNPSPLLRRDLLKILPAGLAAARTARAATTSIAVFPDEPIGTVSPLVHGHFIEHLGGVIYDGIWVGEGSKIANYQGIRKALVDAMRELGATTMRWPGGCFADSYDWRDGVGPTNTRPRRTNFWSTSGRLQKLDPGHIARTDTNVFGTLEFARFCQLIKAEPYFAANLRSLPAAQFGEWIDYCNSPRGSTTWAQRRAAHGSPEPLNVRYWGVGNESWGCGGNFTPEEYSVEFRRFTSWIPRYDNAPLHFIPAGPNSFDYNWTHKFFSRLLEKGQGQLNRVWGWALHYYCSGAGRGESLSYSNDDHYDLMQKANRMEELIERHWAAMAEYDRDHKVKLVIDEWGAWHLDTTAVAPHHLFGSVPTVRDALVAAITLDTFHRHAEKIAMANVAQLINCIQTLFLAHEDKFALTPTYHVFRMYRDHQGGQAVRTEVQSPRVDFRTSGVLRSAGSATRKDRTVTVTFVNTHVSEAMETDLWFGSAKAQSATAEVLAAPEVRAANTFATPDRVKPAPLAVRAANGAVRLTAPPASVVKVTVQL